MITSSSLYQTSRQHGRLQSSRRLSGSNGKGEIGSFGCFAELLT